MSNEIAALVRVLLAVVFLTCAIAGAVTGEKVLSVVAIIGGLSILGWSWWAVGRHV